jgi:hypothetical protein
MAINIPSKIIIVDGIIAQFHGKHTADYYQVIIYDTITVFIYRSGTGAVVKVKQNVWLFVQYRLVEMGGRGETETVHMKMNY